MTGSRGTYAPEYKGRMVELARASRGPDRNPFAVVIKDFELRGPLREALVACGTEFGRTAFARDGRRQGLIEPTHPAS